jgi:transposase
MSRKAYPSDVNDDEWAFVAPYVTLMSEAVPQREYDLREVLNGLRWIIRAGAAWRLMPHDPSTGPGQALPPWRAVYDRTQRWLKAGVFEAIVHDLHEVLRVAAGRRAQPSGVIVDSRTLQSSPESGGWAGYDGAKRKRGSKVHQVVDSLGQLLALHVTPANAGDRAQVAQLAEAVQVITGQTGPSRVCRSGLHE